MRGRGAASYSFRTPSARRAVVAIFVIDVVGDVSLFKSNIGDSSAALWLAAWLLDSVRQLDARPQRFAAKASL